MLWKEKIKQELEGLNYKIIKTFDNEETQAILVGNAQNIVLAFRGTEATSIKDIKSDANAASKKDDSGGQIHSGFEEAKSKSPPRVAFLPNLKPLPSSMFLFTLSSTFTGLSLMSDLL